MVHRMGIGMSRREAENFWRELALILIGVPFLIFIGIAIIDTLLKSDGGAGLGFMRYFLYAIGFAGWVVALYKRYMHKILSHV